MKLASLPEEAEDIAVDARVVYSTDDAVYELVHSGEIEVLDSQSAYNLHALNDVIRWSGMMDGVLWESASSGTVPVLEVEAAVTSFDHAEGVFAWASQDGVSVFSSLATEPIAIATSSVAGLVISNGAAIWATAAEGIFKTTACSSARVLQDFVGFPLTGDRRSRWSSTRPPRSRTSRLETVFCTGSTVA